MAWQSRNAEYEILDGFFILRNDTMCKLCSKDQNEVNDGKTELAIEIRHLIDAQDILSRIKAGFIKPHGEEAGRIKNAAARVIKDLSQYL